MPWEVDEMECVTVGQSLYQRREHAAMQRPAMQQHQGRAAAEGFDMHAAYCRRSRAVRNRGRRPQATAPCTRCTASHERARVVTSPSTSCSECRADSVTRNRALPSGTVGGRIAGTR